jgi:outer membrane immunogenic protein
MNKFPAAASLALALISGSAFAADLPSRKAPPVAVPSAYNWGGLYGGINVGYGFANGTTSTGSLGGTYSDTATDQSGRNYTTPLSAAWRNSSMTPSGVIGGGQIGYNYQMTPMFVAGIEADIQASDMGSTVAYMTPSLQPAGGFTGINNAKNIDWFGTARARIGVVVPGYSNFLVYGTGGFAYGYVNNTVGLFSTIPSQTILSSTIPAGGVSGTSTSGNTQVGWTAGGGVEWSPQTFPAWSAKVEYLYTDLGSTNQAVYGTYAAPGQGVFAANHQSPTQFNTVRAGLNWHFNPFVGEPIVAKY